MDIDTRYWYLSTASAPYAFSVLALASSSHPPPHSRVYSCSAFRKWLQNSSHIYDYEVADTRSDSDALRVISQPLRFPKLLCMRRSRLSSSLPTTVSCSCHRCWSNCLKSDSSEMAEMLVVDQETYCLPDDGFLAVQDSRGNQVSA